MSFFALTDETGEATEFLTGATMTAMVRVRDWRGERMREIVISEETGKLIEPDLDCSELSIVPESPDEQSDPINFRIEARRADVLERACKRLRQSSSAA